MKRLWVAGLVLVGVSAHAQYTPTRVGDAVVEQSMQAGEVCKRNSDGVVVCRYVGSSANAAPPPTLAHGVRTWGALNPQWPSAMPIAARYCLKKKEFVLAKFALGAARGNSNALMETYYWNGVSEETAHPFFERLEQVAVSGHWERSYVEQWDGPHKMLARLPVYVRWVTDDATLPVLHFTLRQDPEFGCWFLQAVPTPSDTVQISGVYSQGRIITETQSPAFSDSVDNEADSGFVQVQD